MKILRFCIIVLVLIFTAGVLWLFSCHLLFYQETVLKVPIRFEEGFSVRSDFTIDLPQIYWVAIQYDETFQTTREAPIPRDEFTAEFEVKSKEQVIAKGSTANHPDWSGPWLTNRDKVTRYLESFQAERGKKYSLSLKITRLLPGLVGKNPQALVVIDWKFDEFRQLREFLLIGLGIIIGILFLIERLLTRRKRSKLVQFPGSN
jgi:hypothetical protein